MEDVELPPFLSNDPMEGDPPSAWADFLTPRLRRFPLAYENVWLRNRLGHGIEGCVGRVRFDDDERSFALKIFFSSVPEEGSASSWWPLEREARNVAVLDKVAAGLRQSPDPVYVPAKRTTRLDCLRCLYAFSAEGRQTRPFGNLPADKKVAISESFTRVRKCFGWTRVRGADFMPMNRIIQITWDPKGIEGSASHLRKDREYFAIVYEYLPTADLEVDPLQRQLDFFHHVGFDPCQLMHKRNWQGPGILLDFGDYNSPVDRWFDARGAWFPCPTAKDVLEPAHGREEAQRKWDRIQKFGTTEEDKRKEEKRTALKDTAMYVERAYKGNLFPSYFDLTPEERQNLKLEEDPLAHIPIREIEPETVREPWRVYNRQKREYLSKVKPVEDPPGEE